MKFLNCYGLVCMMFDGRNCNCLEIILKMNLGHDFIVGQKRSRFNEILLEITKVYLMFNYRRVILMSPFIKIINVLPVMYNCDDEDEIGHHGNGTEANVNGPPPSFFINQFVVALEELVLYHDLTVLLFHDFSLQYNKRDLFRE